MIDITRTIGFDTLVYPHDPGLKINLKYSIKKGDGWNLFGIEMSNHCGTHMDAPLHRFKSGKDLNEFSSTHLITKCNVIQIKSKSSVSLKEVKRHDIQRGESVLFKTLNSKLSRKSFNKKYIFIEGEVAEYLKDLKVKIVGLDYLSLDPFNSDIYPVHNILLKNNILILEDVDLRKVKPGKYTLYCFPLKLYNANGAPCRAFLM